MVEAGIAPSVYRLDSRGIGVQIPVKVRIFSLPLFPGRIWGHTWVHEVLSPKVKWPRREADCSPPTNDDQEDRDLYIHSLPHKSSWGSV
jgi:hypothetical protein